VTEADVGNSLLKAVFTTSFQTHRKLPVFYPFVKYYDKL